MELVFKEQHQEVPEVPRPNQMLPNRNQKLEPFQNPVTFYIIDHFKSEVTKQTEQKQEIDKWHKDRK